MALRHTLYQSEELSLLKKKKKKKKRLVFSKTLKNTGRQPPAAMLRPHPEPIDVMTVHWAMAIAFRIWYVTRDTPPNNNYWPLMSRCSTSRLIILRTCGRLHPFIFSQFENEAPRGWADPQKKRKILIFWLFKHLLLFLMRRIFGFTLSLMFPFLLEDWWECRARFCKSSLVSVDRI